MPKEIARQSATGFVRAIEQALAPLADKGKAVGASAYMRNQFSFLGIPTPQRRAAIGPLIRAFHPANSAPLRQSAETLWRKRHREYQYSAVDLLARKHAFLRTADLPWILKLAQQKSWWDTVDALAKVVGRIVRKEPVRGARAMDRALGGKNFWVRRIAMLHQLGWRTETDVDRLFAYADALASETEFFIRKAIGWALRDFAWHDPNAVRLYLAAARDRLSALSYREASLHLLERGDPPL